MTLYRSPTLEVDRGALLVSFSVGGVPAPGGSKTIGYVRDGGGRVRHREDGNPMAFLRDAGKGNKKWRKAVSDTAALAWGDRASICDPCVLDVTFYMPRPKCHYRTGRFAHLLKSDAPLVHSVKPDVDKLLRSTADALTDAGLWVDDCIAHRGPAMKLYAEHGEPTGAVIRISELVATRQMQLPCHGD